MTLLVGNNSEVIILEAMLNKTAAEDLTIRLYSNDRTPIEADLVGDYTEVSGSGYAAVALTASSWTVVAGDPTTASYPEVTFTFTGAAGSVYGYYITQNTSGALMWAEKFDAVINIQNNGDEIRITPQITLE